MYLDKFSLKDKVALVTGGGTGIGRAISLAFAETGADVVVSSRKIENLERVAGEIKESGRRALPVAAHLGHIENIDVLIGRVIEEFGKLDILVNNAGTNPVQVPFLDEVYDNERLWDSIINLNLKGPYFLTRAVAKVMKEQGRGNIINISSIDGVVPGVGESIYDISKAGLIHLTKVAAKDLAGYNIRVNCIIPGMVKTRMSGVLVKQPEAAKPWNAGIPMGRFAGPDEIAGAAVYLASDASSYATGACITVDGGVLCMGNPAPKDWTFTGK